MLASVELDIASFISNEEQCKIGPPGSGKSLHKLIDRNQRLYKGSLRDEKLHFKKRLREDLLRLVGTC